MIGLLLKPSFAFTLLFALWIVLIRAQPYDDSELRAFLNPPEGCAAPCFMGIRPGVTTLDGAVAILERHQWVDRVYITETLPRSLGWTWSGNQPALIDGSQNGSLITQFQSEIVEAISFGTTVPIANVYLLLGRTAFTDSSIGGRSGEIFVTAVYFDQDMIVSGMVPSCPVTYSKFWKARMNIQISSGLNLMTGFSSINFACG